MTNSYPRICLYIQPGFKLEGYPYCYSGTPFAIKLERLFNFKALPFKTVEIGWTVRNRVLEKISRAHKLPVAEINGRFIEDSSQIAYFVEDLVPYPALVPGNAQQRAQMHFLEDWADEVLYWYLAYGQLFFNNGYETGEAYFPNQPPEVRHKAIETIRSYLEKCLKAQGMGRYPATKFSREFHRSLDHLSNLVEVNPYLVGEECTLADLAVFGQLHRAMGGTHPWFEVEMERRSALAEWWHRVDLLTYDYAPFPESAAAEEGDQGNEAESKTPGGARRVVNESVS